MLLRSFHGVPKARTRISGRDELTSGGLPRGRPTLVCGGAGCGKIVLGVEFVREPGAIFTFEETGADLEANMASFGLDLAGLVAKKQLVGDHVQVDPAAAEETGAYDLERLFIRLAYAIDSIGAKRPPRHHRDPLRRIANKDMSRSPRARAKEDASVPEYLLRLFVSGLTLLSQSATEHLREYSERHVAGRYRIEVVDLYQAPERAAQEQIVATPTHIKVLPLPGRRLIGDLFRGDRFLRGLDIRGRSGVTGGAGSPPEAARVKRALTSRARSLRARLDEVEKAHAAIRSGKVDALATQGPAGERVFTLEGADHDYRVLLEAMSDSVAKLTPSGTIVFCNASFSAILGVTLEQTVGSQIHELVVPEERQRVEALLAVGTRERSEGEFRVRGAPVDIPVLLSVVPLQSRGEPSHCLVMIDLTKQRMNSDAIAAERAAMNTRLLLADRMSSMGTLATGVAHEINNPLAYVIASLDLMIGRLPDLSDDGDQSEQTAWMRRQLERAREGSTRVRVIVRDLKAFTRADDETLDFADLRRLLDTAIALVSNDIRHRARLVREYEDLPAVRVNEARIGQVFVNLLVNASHAIAPGGVDRNEIRVSAHPDFDGNAVVEIRDTGAGSAAENLDRIFEPFFTMKPVSTGTGLGLALCRGIVASPGGQITVESTLGEGTTLRVLIPAAPLVARHTDIIPRTVRVESRGRLLVVDDEEDLCDVLEETLSPSADVRTTTDADRALAWIAGAERFEMMLCDMNMPKMTGVDFYTRLSMVSAEQADRLVLMSGG